MWPESAPWVLAQVRFEISAYQRPGCWGAGGRGGSRPVGGLEVGEAARWKGLLLNPAPVGFKPF